jgi:cell division protein FtsL
LENLQFLRATWKLAEIQEVEVPNYMFLRKEKNKPFYKLLVTTYVVYFVLNMISLNFLSVKSAEFKKLETEISSLNDSISNLNFKLSKASSISDVEDRAKKLGFVKINQDIKVISASFAYNFTNEN